MSVSGSGASLLDVIKRLMNLHQVIGLISAIGCYDALFWRW